MFLGGIADKLGNRYEAKWLVRQLLDVIAGKSEWLRFEGIASEFQGFEFALGRTGFTEWHQTKMNATHGNWTIRALERENVLASFKNQLEASVDNRCIFVSQDPAKDLRMLIEKASVANNTGEFTKALSIEQERKFSQVTEAWGEHDEIAFAWLKRCRCLTIPEEELEAIISSYSDLYFATDGSSVFPALRDFLEKRFNAKLTTEIVRAEIRDAGAPIIKDWQLDPTLREKLRSETDAYLQSYNPFGAGGSTIPRPETSRLANTILQRDGPLVVLLTGRAGSGKSGVIRGLIDQLSKSDITSLAFRVDHYLSCKSPSELGLELVGRRESPATTLKGLEPERLSVLVVDQVDAISEISGRSGSVKETLLRLVSDVRNFETVRLILVCRSFDLESDPRLKALKEEDRVRQIEVPLLDWENEVVPLLSEQEIDTKALSETQKNLLCLPLILSVFLDVGSDGQSFTSLNDLFERLIEKKERAIAIDRSLAWTVAAPLSRLAKWMSERQRLDADQSVLDDFPRALDLLASEGLIVRTRNRVNFFHESFFDYLYARDFVGRDQTLVELLTSTEQHLFRRTQTRQILEALRQNDRGRYFHELGAVLTSDAIRYHIKATVAQWLGALADPTQKECDIALQLDAEDGPFPPLVRYAILASPGWFDRLHSSGWIELVLNGEDADRQQAVLWWLSNIAGARPAKIAELLSAWWNIDPQRGNRLVDWFGSARRQKPDKALLALCERVIRSNPPDLFKGEGSHRRELLLATWAEKNTGEGSELLKALFDAWFEAHPDDHPFERAGLSDNYSLSQIAEKSPKAFLSGTVEALSRSIDLINRKEAAGEPDYSFRHRAYSGHRVEPDEFLGLFRSALCRIADEEPNEAIRFLSLLDASKHGVLLHLHLEAISANGRALAKRFMDLLDSAKLFEAGWEGARHKSFADAARAVFPFLSNKDRRRVEDVIFAHNPEIDCAVEVAHEIREEGESKPYRTRRKVVWALNQSGFEQWCTLESIGADLLTEKGVQRLSQLRRKFPTREVPEPRHMEAITVGSPIKRDQAAHITDSNWLEAINRYKSDDERQRGSGFVDGGATELAGELQHAASEDPERFVAILKLIPQDAHPTYVAHVLWGLANSGEVGEEALKTAILVAHTRSERSYGREIAGIFDKHPQIARDPSVFDVLGWYAENGDAYQEETVRTPSAETEIVSINDLMARDEALHSMGINGTRGRVAQALGTILWKVPEAQDSGWRILEQRVAQEPLVSVRCCLMRPLAALFNKDQSRCAQLVEQLVSAPTSVEGAGAEERTHLVLSPLTTHEGVNLLQYVLHSAPAIGRRLLDRLLDSGDETMRLIGAWHVFWQSFRVPEYASEADDLIGEGVVYRRLAAGVASGAATSEEFRERSEQQLVQFFDDNDKQVRQQAAHVFRNTEPEEFGRFIGICEAYIRSRALEDDSFAFFHALEKATSNVRELVIEAAERLIAVVASDWPDSVDHSLDLHKLRDLIKREYAQSEDDPKLRERLLNLIDTMLAHEVYGTEEILRAHER